MHGGAAVLQLRGQGTVPMFSPSGLNGSIILLRYAENEPRGSNSYCRGILEGEMPKCSLKAYAPSSARLFRGDPARFYLALTPGRRWERVDRCEQREPLIPVTEEVARHFAVWLPPGERRQRCLFVGCDSPAKETAGMEELFFLIYFFFKNFGCTYWQIVGEGRAWFLPTGGAALNSTSPAQRRGSWALPGCWVCFKSIACLSVFGEAEKAKESRTCVQPPSSARFC